MINNRIHVLQNAHNIFTLERQTIRQGSASKFGIGAKTHICGYAELIKKIQKIKEDLNKPSNGMFEPYS